MMKNYLQNFRALSLLVTLLFYSTTFGQTLFLRDDGTTVVISKKVGANFTDLDSNQLKKEVEVKRGLIIDASGLPNSYGLKISTVTAAGVESDITNVATQITKSGSRYTYLGIDAAIKILKIEVTPPVAGGRAATVFADIGKEFVAPVDDKDPDKDQEKSESAKYDNWRQFVSQNSGGALDIIKGGKRYFPNSDKAYICVDPYGNIIGRKPVNLDQDDEVIFLVVVPEVKYDDYSIDDNDAEYAPTDLAFRPADAITNNVQSGNVDEPIKYTIREFIKGPYTSSNVVFNVKKDGATVSTFTIHINPLYHVAIGVSYVSSNLENPTFDVVPLADSSGLNTIQRFNNTNRTLITFNVIWYWWSTLKYLQGDPLTRGRDVLKEPNLITRINPTFGVSLKGNLQENFFAGLTFEFARGGSICAGWHYGKVTQLSDRNFELGSTAFAGTQADIRTEEVWKWGQFIGITLDTRIFNRLFNRSVTGN